MFTVLLYALLIPRFKIDSMILLIPAVLYVIRKYSQGLSFILLFVIVSLSTRWTVPRMVLVDLFWIYYLLLMVLALWGLWLWSINRKQKTSTP